MVTDTGKIGEKVRQIWPGGADKVLELIGTITLEDSMRVTRPRGIVCMSGIVGGSWTLDGWNPMEHIPQGVCLTAYTGGRDDFMEIPLNDLVRRVKEGRLKLQLGRTFELHDILEAHRFMDKNQALGKLVVLT